MDFLEESILAVVVVVQEADGFLQDMQLAMVAMAGLEELQLCI
jgi:hypothetical protein